MEKFMKEKLHREERYLRKEKKKRLPKKNKKKILAIHKQNNLLSSPRP